jgi:hypothetical protein
MSRKNLLLVTDAGLVTVIIGLAAKGERAWPWVLVRLRLIAAWRS